MKLCMVRQCPYRATGAIDDFLVCALHDAPATRGLLERLLAPAAYYAHEVPVVLPVGPLEEGDLIVIGWSNGVTVISHVSKISTLKLVLGRIRPPGNSTDHSVGFSLPKYTR